MLGGRGMPFGEDPILNSSDVKTRYAMPPSCCLRFSRCACQAGGGGGQGRTGGWAVAGGGVWGGWQAGRQAGDGAGGLQAGRGWSRVPAGRQVGKSRPVGQAGWVGKGAGRQGGWARVPAGRVGGQGGRLALLGR